MGSVLDFLGEAMMDGDPSPASADQRERIQRVAIDLLVPDPNQPRQYFDGEKLENLAESIRQMDLLQPILVRDDATQLVIVDGERRWRAARLAGLSEVPVVFSEQAAARVLLAQVVANENRENLSDIELARVIDTLKREYKITGRALGKLLNRNDAQISRLMLLVKNPEIMQLAEEGVLSCAEHAALFASLDPERQSALVTEARANQTALTYQDLVAERKKPTESAMPLEDTEDHADPVTHADGEPSSLVDDSDGDRPGVEEPSREQQTCDRFQAGDQAETMEEHPEPECPADEPLTKTGGFRSLTLTTAQFANLLAEESEILESFSSITVKAPADVIDDLSARFQTT